MSEPAARPEVRRFRAGWYPVTSMLLALVFVGMGVLVVVLVANGTTRGWHVVVSVVFALVFLGVGLPLAAYCATGLVPVRVVPGATGTIAIAPIAFPPAVRRVRWPLVEVQEIRLERHLGVRDRRVSATFVGTRGRVECISLTCRAYRRHPERTAAGRAVAEIRTLVAQARTQAGAT